MNILINTPFIRSPAGVANHFLGLRPYFSRRVIYNQFITGNLIRRKIHWRCLHRPVRALALIYDICKFVLLLFYYYKPIVLLNPSLIAPALKRDAIYLTIAKLFGCKVGVFIHGWDPKHYSHLLLDNHDFLDSYGKADCFFVLSDSFKTDLKKIGINVPIFVTTTKVNDALITGTADHKTYLNIRNLLFLARIEREKGIIIAIEAFQILKHKFPDLRLRIVGDGRLLSHAKDYVVSNNVPDVLFTGPLYVDEVKREYQQADLYMLPTYHDEGMPTSVLEAMAFGLPIITRPVGGLRDFFVDGKMGYLIESLSPVDYADKIASLITDIPHTQQISDYNTQYARTHFMASTVAPWLENKLLSI